MESFLQQERSGRSTLEAPYQKTCLHRADKVVCPCLRKLLLWMLAVVLGRRDAARAPNIEMILTKRLCKRVCLVISQSKREGDRLATIAVCAEVRMSSGRSGHRYLIKTGEVNEVDEVDEVNEIGEMKKLIEATQMNQANKADEVYEIDKATIDQTALATGCGPKIATDLGKALFKMVDCGSKEREAVHDAGEPSYIDY